MENTKKVLVVKDEEGELRPQAGIWEVNGDEYDRAVRFNWDNNLSKNKYMKDCTLVEATLTEVSQ